MIQHLVRLLIAILLSAPALGVSDVAHAQAGLQQVPLTRDLVQRFLASFPELKALGKSYEGTVPRRSSGKNNPLEALSGYMSNRAARADMQRVLGPHGFAGFPDWIKVAQSVALAYGYAKSGKTVPEIESKANDAIARIQNNKRFTPEQKARMIDLLRRQGSVVAQFRPLPANVELVRDMMSEVAAVMDSD